jgi:hypothetical protein
MGSWTGTVPSFGVRAVPAADLQTMADILTAATGAWSSWSPTLTNLTLGNGTHSALYRQVGKTVDFIWSITLGSTSAVGTAPKFTLPVAPHASLVRTFPATVRLLDVSATFGIGLADFSGGTTIDLSYHTSTTAFAPITALAPWTWATGDIISAFGTYPTA